MTVDGCIAIMSIDRYIKRLESIRVDCIHKYVIADPLKKGNLKKL